MSESLSYKDSGIFLYPVPAGFQLNPNYILRISSPKLRAKHFYIHLVRKFLRNPLKKSPFVPAYCRTAFSFIKMINSSTVSRSVSYTHLAFSSIYYLYLSSLFPIRPSSTAPALSQGFSPLLNLPHLSNCSRSLRQPHSLILIQIGTRCV